MDYHRALVMCCHNYTVQGSWVSEISITLLFVRVFCESVRVYTMWGSSRFKDLVDCYKQDWHQHIPDSSGLKKSTVRTIFMLQIIFWEIPWSDFTSEFPTSRLIDTWTPWSWTMFPHLSVSARWRITPSPWPPSTRPATRISTVGLQNPTIVL